MKNELIDLCSTCRNKDICKWVEETTKLKNAVGILEGSIKGVAVVDYRCMRYEKNEVILGIRGGSSCG